MCAARSCDEFWSQWSDECSGYCSDGKDPGREYRTFSFQVPDEEDDIVAAGCNVANGFVEERNCTSWPRCLSSCSEHWSEWSECSDFCSGGVRLRTFGVTSGAAPPDDYQLYTNSEWDWADFLQKTCHDEQGDLEQINCTSWETCEIVGKYCDLD